MDLFSLVPPVRGFEPDGAILVPRLAPWATILRPSRAIWYSLKPMCARLYRRRLQHLACRVPLQPIECHEVNASPRHLAAAGSARHRLARLDPRQPMDSLQGNACL